MGQVAAPWVLFVDDDLVFRVNLDHVGVGAQSREFWAARGILTIKAHVGTCSAGDQFRSLSCHLRSSILHGLFRLWSTLDRTRSALLGSKGQFFP